MAMLPNSYTDVTGVIDATAAAEVVVLLNQFKALIPDPTKEESAATPDFMDMEPHVAANLRADFTALAAAIAAAPTT